MDKTPVLRNAGSSLMTDYVVCLIDKICISHLDRNPPSDKDYDRDYTGPSVKRPKTQIKGKSSQQCNTLDRYLKKVT